MSSMSMEQSAVADPTTRHQGAPSSRSQFSDKASAWRWMILACLVIGVSGAIRAVRDRQFALHSDAHKDSPFPLVEISKKIGDWRSIDTTEARLDPEIAKIAGSTDHILRTYSNSKTGETVHVMVLYGLAENVFGHTPEVCYPASGHQKITSPEDTVIRIDGVSEPVTYRTQIFYQRVGPASSQYTEVCYLFRHAGTWRPDMAGQWKTFRYNPGMFKIQTSREVSAGAANPEAHKSDVSESILIELVKEIENHLSKVQGSKKSEKG